MSGAVREPGQHGDEKRPPSAPPLPPPGPTLDDWAAKGRRAREASDAAPGVVGSEVSAAAPASMPTSSAPSDPTVMERRTVLKVLAAAAAAPTMACGGSVDDEGDLAADMPAQPSRNPHATGTPTDPDLLSPVVPWETLLTDAEMVTVAALADVIIPADERSPSASAVGAHQFVNEWVSAPYEAQERDLVLVRGGLVWLNTESLERFGATFAELTTEQQRAICDDVRHVPDALPEYRAGARFFDKMRDLVATGFWTTEEGMADLGYRGNVPLPAFEGPPAEVLDRLGLA